MKSSFNLPIVVLSLSILIYPLVSLAQSPGYKAPDEVVKWVKQIEKAHPGIVTTFDIATTPGNRPVQVIGIGKGSPTGSYPSIFVGANLEGNRPLATEGAIFLAETILAQPENFDSLTWYILPLGNPDAAARYFSAPLFEDSRNDLPTNDDGDDLTDEDGINDLNGDGWITKMRVAHPDGEWIQSESDPRLMRKADPKKGELGQYKLYSEGTDDDHDGSYNEDGPGGTNVGINFPQLYRHFTTNGGQFPGSTPESYGIMKFVFDRPEIAMIVSFGSTNWCFTPPKGGRKGEADLNNIKLSERQARQFNLDRDRSYTLQEITQIVNSENPGSNLDESTIAGYLGLGAALNPQERDLLFYEKYTKAYQSYLKERGVLNERIDPSPAKDGSFELWSYFQVGVPVYSMDLWGIEKDTAINKSESDSERIILQKSLLSTIEEEFDGKGFLEWEPFDHPTLGAVEIGGFIPYAGSTPPYEWADSLVQLQVPWILELAGELPNLHIYKVETSAKGKGIFQLDIWIENRAFIPFPTAMGSRNRQPAPAVLSLEGDQIEFLSGYKRTPVQRVGSKSMVKTSLLIQLDKPGMIEVRLDSKTAGTDHETIKIGD